MPSSDSPGAIDSDSLQTVLAGLDSTPKDLDDRGRQQAALLAFGRLANAEPPAWILMEDAAAMVAEIVGADRIGVGEVSRGGGELNLKVGTVDSRGGIENPQSNRYAMDPALSMAGYALGVATPVSSPELASEKRFTDLFLRKLGVVSALTVPLHFNGRPFGALGVYADRKRPFSLEDVQFAETIAHLLTSSLARNRAEEKLQEEQSFASTVLDLVDTLVFTLDVEGRVAGFNRATQRLTGFSLDEIHDRPFWSVFVAPEDSDLVQGIFRSSRNDGAPSEFEGSLMTKQGTRKRVSWSMKRMSDGRVQSIILSGVDQTEKIRTRSELDEVRQIAQRATRALKELCATTDIAGGSAGATPLRPETPGVGAGDGGRHAEGTRLFQPVGGGAAVEQRITLRRAYRYKQWIGPVTGNGVPNPEDFFEVQCNDISAGGVSFFLNGPPDFETLVVALGREPALSYFTARVARVAGVAHDGPKVYLVGCRFTGRVQLQGHIPEGPSLPTAGTSGSERGVN